MGRNNKYWMSATNHLARMDFARIVLNGLEELADRARRQCPAVSFVTLVPNTFAVPESHAHDFDRRKLKKLVRRTLKGQNYIGMIEPALYSRIVDTCEEKRGTISWHVHVIVWGRNRKNLKKRIKRFNNAYSSLLERVDPGHLKPISWDSFVRSALYMLKSPRADYRNFHQGLEVVDERTGEILHERPDRQRKTTLRTGQHVRMRNVLRYQRLDQLMVFGGDGRPVAKRNRRQALWSLRRKKDLERG